MISLRAKQYEFKVISSNNLLIYYVSALSIAMLLWRWCTYTFLTFTIAFIPQCRFYYDKHATKRDCCRPTLFFWFGLFPARRMVYPAQGAEPEFCLF